jgi:nuclear transport factor 2 (NTF2) superfamily protein
VLTAIRFLTLSIRDPVTVSKAYTPDSIWRNRHWFFTGTEPIVEFLTKKWQREKNYKLRKELFAFTDNKIAVQFWYEVGLRARLFHLLLQLFPLD